MYDVIIIGAGPAGLTAALYALRAGKTALLIEKASFGGQIVFSPLVENYPALKKVSGMEFADALVEQVTELGAEIEIGTALSISEKEGCKTVTTESGIFDAKAVIIAGGAQHRRLGVQGEDAFVGKGISYCAVCDGAFFKGKDVAVVGGGNTAVQDALYLSDICSKVYLVHRRDEFRAEKRLIDMLQKKENIELVLNSTVSALSGDGKISEITTTDKNTQEKRMIPVSGLFVAIGQQADCHSFSGIIEVDGGGYAVADENCQTNTAGIFVAGDCRTKNIRQLTTAVGDGAVAAIAACSYVDSLK